MNYDGIVLKINNKLFLFIINPDTNELMDGVNISEHKCYNKLNNDQLMVVNVLFKDGTKNIEKIDLEEFIYGESYGNYDVFLYIQDKKLYTINDTLNSDIKNLSFVEIIKSGEFSNIAKECIKNTKEKEKDE